MLHHVFVFTFHNFLSTGIMEFHNCPCEPLLPLFLSLNGTALLFKCVLQGARIMCNIAPPEGERHCLYTVTDMLTLFLVFWGCTGRYQAYLSHRNVIQ